MLLNLPNLTVINQDQTDDDMCIVVETDYVPTRCPQCSNLFGSFYGHGTRPQFFHDLPMLGKRVALKIHRKRFKCRDCNGTFEEPLEIMHHEHTMTRRLSEYIIKECYRNKFTDVARHTGPTEKTIRNVFRSHVDKLVKRYSFETPRILGIDEINVRGMRCVITNLEEKTILDMLPTRSMEDVTGYLLKLDRSAVKLISMDMWYPYFQACSTAFPNAKIVVDRFHVQKQVNEIMTKVRVDAIRDLPRSQRKFIKDGKYILLSRNFNLTEQQQDMLIAWCKICPILGHVYEYKERFMDIWEAPDRATAERLYDEWKTNLPKDVRPHFKKVTTSFKNWRVQIFNWWDHRITNAFTESVNGKIRELHRSGRGYSFDVLRAKIISKAGLHKVKAIPPKYNKNAFEFTRTICSPPTVNYGVDISTLLTLNFDDLME